MLLLKISIFFPFSLTELPARFFGYDLSLLDTPYSSYIFILGRKSNEAVSILEECSLLIFQSLVIPACAILIALRPYFALVKSIALINGFDLFSKIGANKFNSFSEASLSFDKIIPAF